MGASAGGDITMPTASISAGMKRESACLCVFRVCVRERVFVCMCVYVGVDVCVGVLCGFSVFMCCLG